MTRSPIDLTERPRVEESPQDDPAIDRSGLARGATPGLPSPFKATQRPTRRERLKDNFQGTAMSRAEEVGVRSGKAAIAFGCTPETVRLHQFKIAETATSVSMMDRIKADK